MATNAFDDGYTDGSLAALTGLDSRTAHDHIDQLAEIDPLRAQGFADGFIDTTTANATRNHGGTHS
ncbi:hypothetical protein [Streptomyces olivaceiscleroticus]|uniref:Uncharacterized protein n=1 Tax=Streptomyces olivaceiscleroticus TaxID=68245 RepID=A0ABP3LKN2_9ACTN